MEKPAVPPPPPHVLFFPFPVQGHLTSMLKLAELLSHAGINITFLISSHTHSRLLRFTDVQTRFNPYPGFHFLTFPDDLDGKHPESVEEIMEISDSMKATTKPFLKELLVSDSLSGDSMGPMTSIISDGTFGFVLDVAEDVGIPIIYFRTSSSSSFWAYFCIPELVEGGELPFIEKDMDVLVKNAPGLEGILRRRDLPSFCRVQNIADGNFQIVSTESGKARRANGLIFNTSEDLEGPILSQIRTHCPNVYSIGPLHALIHNRLASETTKRTSSSNSLWEEDKSCMKWLDKQPLKSVIYVSFGSIATITRDQLMEIWHGLVSSRKRFLWVVRQDSGTDKELKNLIPTELKEGTKERGYMVGWAPQEEVLAHPSVGGFLTHSGWNSTLESIVERVPMICWPHLGDQLVNSRFVAEVWKIGLDMKDTCDRVTVEKMVRDLMEVRRDEFVKSLDQMAKLAKKSTSKDGSSYFELDRLIENIRLMAVHKDVQGTP